MSKRIILVPKLRGVVGVFGHRYAIAVTEHYPRHRECPIELLSKIKKYVDVKKI